MCLPPCHTLLLNDVFAFLVSMDARPLLIHIASSAFLFWRISDVLQAFGVRYVFHVSASLFGVYVQCVFVLYFSLLTVRLNLYA